jgi:hypothetical protein
MTGTWAHSVAGISVSGMKYASSLWVFGTTVKQSD